jgi:hypothetical protein
MAGRWKGKSGNAVARGRSGMSGMNGSTREMVKVKMCATFQETSAAIKEGCRVTQIVTKSRVIGAGKWCQPSGMKTWTTNEMMNLGKGSSQGVVTRLGGGSKR